MKSFFAGRRQVKYSGCFPFLWDQDDSESEYSCQLRQQYDFLEKLLYAFDISRF
jgi:hypothetical protein